MNINKLFERYGITVHLSNLDGWNSPNYKVFLQPLRYKNKLYMTGDFTPIGRNTHDIYLYLGPKAHDITKLDNTYRVVDVHTNKYVVDRAEEIKFNDETVYIWAIIRKVSEAKEW